MRVGGDGAADNPAALALRRRLSELANLVDEGSGPKRWEKLGDCEVVVPQGQFPWGVLFFLGGAVLGQYPRLCYDALLRPLADRSGCAVIVVPYEVDTDHAAIANSVDERFNAALDLAASRYGWDASRMPIFALGHSLGAKLHVIRHCGSSEKVKAEPVAVMAFNNFGVADQLTLAKQALEAFQGGAAPPGLDMLWNALEPMARRAAKSAGIEFTPGPEEMEDMVRAGYSAPSTRVLAFGVDPLDCSEDLIDSASDRGQPMMRARLIGNHLTPVLLKVADLAGEAVGGNMGQRLGAAAREQGLEVGNADELEDLLEDLAGWLRPATARQTVDASTA